MSLNQFQKIAAAAYAGGDTSWVTTMEEAARYRDTLFLFIMRELATSEDCENIDTAVRRMERAIEDIQCVLTQLEIAKAETE